MKPVTVTSNSAYHPVHSKIHRQFTSPGHEKKFINITYIQRRVNSIVRPKADFLLALFNAKLRGYAPTYLVYLCATQRYLV